MNEHHHTRLAGLTLTPAINDTQYYKEHKHRPLINGKWQYGLLLYWGLVTFGEIQCLFSHNVKHDGVSIMVYAVIL